jgi:sugar phosphate isomerase/epimerase
MGVFAFLPKPFDRKELEEMAKRFFSQEEAKASVIAAQLYTLRDFTKTPDDIRATMKKVRQLGYDAVQLSALGPIDPHNLKDVLDAEKLKVVATHTGYDRICDEPQAVIDDHLLWNCPHVAIGGLPGEYRNAEGFGRFAREASEAVKPLIDAGLTFSYHNHSFELERFGAKTGLDILMEESDPNAFSFEIDTYWIQHGGGNPASWLEKLKGRMHVVHLKDMAMDGGTQLFAEVGEGNLEWEAILKACREAEIKWYIIEQDTCQRDPFDCLGTSLANLQAMGLH